MESQMRTQILCWLPAKSLVRFRCVSKNWASLFAEPHFAKLHCQQQNVQLIARDGLLYSLDLYSLDCAFRVDYILQDTNFKVYNVLGCTNGMLCLSVYKNPQEEYVVVVVDEKDLVIVICNLSTGACHTVPFSPVDIPHKGLTMHCGLDISYGFGFDPSGDDYKLVRICQSVWNRYDGNPLSEVKVYSMRTNSWTNVNHDNIVVYSGVVFIKGPLHWVGKNSILAFDLADGVHSFRELLPVLGNKFKGMKLLSLGSLAGHLCAIFIEYFISSYQLHYFVMEEYGDVNSWTPLSSLNLPLPDTNLLFCTCARAFLRSGDTVSHDNWFCCDLTNNTTYETPIKLTSF